MAKIIYSEQYAERVAQERADYEAGVAALTACSKAREAEAACKDRRDRRWSLVIAVVSVAVGLLAQASPAVLGVAGGAGQPGGCAASGSVARR